MILLIGKNGQVGWELERLLGSLGPLVSLDVPDIDLADPESIRSVVRAQRPRLVVNAAAYTAVDKAEEERELAMAVNGVAPGLLAEEMKRSGGALVHYSTDYVFDGEKSAPYREDDRPNPVNEYGRTKLAGEEAVRAVAAPHLIFRTSWVYGARGQNFLLTMLRLFRQREELRIVADQIGAPTWSRLIAEVTVQVLRCSGAVGDPSALPRTDGLYHLTAGGATSWYGFAESIRELDPARETQLVRRLVPISTGEFPTWARRPRNSRLDCSHFCRTFGISLPRWDDSLGQVMGQIADRAGEEEALA